MQNIVNPESIRQMSEINSPELSSTGSGGELIKEPLDYLSFDEKEVEAPKELSGELNIDSEPTDLIKEPLDEYFDENGITKEFTDTNSDANEVGKPNELSGDLYKDPESMDLIKAPLDEYVNGVGDVTEANLDEKGLVKPNEVSGDKYFDPESKGQSKSPLGSYIEDHGYLNEADLETKSPKTLNPENVEQKPEVNEVKRLSFDEQTIDNDKLEEWRNQPENQGKLDLGKEHSSTVLSNNLCEVMETDQPENSAAHHIVGNNTPVAAAKLDEFGIDRNDPANGIFLPTSHDSECKGSLHTGNHLNSYYEEVDRRFQNVSSREEALEVLQSLKEDLYNGDLPLQNDTPNK